MFLLKLPCVYHLGTWPVQLDPFARWGLRQVAAVIAPFSEVAKSWRNVGLTEFQNCDLSKLDRYRKVSSASADGAKRAENKARNIS